MNPTLTVALGVSTPADMLPHGELVWETHTSLRWSASTRYELNFHALRETPGGHLRGALGACVDPQIAATLDLRAAGPMRTTVRLDEDGRLRVRITRVADAERDTGVGIGVIARAELPSGTSCNRVLTSLIDANGGDQRIIEALECLAAYEKLAPETQEAFADVFGEIATDLDLAVVRSQLDPLRRIGDAILARASEALERKCGVAVATHYARATREEALLECSFAFTPEGLDLYRSGLAGDFSSVSAAGTANGSDATIDAGVFTAAVAPKTTLELHLPFLDGRQWQSKLDILAHSGVRTGADGQLMVCHTGASTATAANAHQGALMIGGAVLLHGSSRKSEYHLSHTDERAMPARRALYDLDPMLSLYGFDPAARQWLQEAAAATPDRQIVVDCTLRIPGEMATCWLDVPDERRQAFLQRFVRVSGAIQRAMRFWLPYVYFQDGRRYETLGAAYPMLIYQSTRPNAGDYRNSYNYDAIDSKSMHTAWWHAKNFLPGVLQRVHTMLLAGGNRQLADYYFPVRANAIISTVQRRPHPLRSLLMADNFFVEELIRLGNRACELRKSLDKRVDRLPKHLGAFSARFVKAFHTKLRNLYGGESFLGFGSLILVEATRALHEITEARDNLTITKPYTPVQALLRLRPAGAEHPQVFVNAEYSA